jgi:hypothetical protein
LPGGTDFGEYETVQETKLYLNKLHLKDCSVNDGVYLRIGFVSVEDFVLSNLKLPLILWKSVLPIEVLSI